MLSAVRSLSYHSLPAGRRPVAAAAPDGPTDRIELSAAPESGGAPRGLVKSALRAAGEACKGVLFGPVAHCVGKVVTALGQAPEPRQPKLPPSELGPLPQSTLSRPVVFVAGWHTLPARFAPIGDKLTEGGANGGAVGYLKGGQAYRDPDCTEPLVHPPADMKVFVSLLESSRTAPDAAQPELDRNLETVRRLTGGATTDIVAFSMGGLQSRLFVDEHEHPNFGKVLFLATPHQGAGLAGLSHHLLEGKKRGWDTDWLLRIKDVQEGDAGSLQWLRPSSEQRHDLNSRWETQKGRVEEVLCLGSASKRTLGASLFVGKGDGMVPESSLHLRGLPVEVVDEPCSHGELIQSPKVYMRMRDYFGWGD